MTKPSFYVGPLAVQVDLSTLALVESAAQSGVLDERAWVELKKDIPRTSRAANLELAKDLASLSVDAGLLVVGIEDDGGKAGEVVGTTDAALRDRIVQVATGSVHPSLFVEVYDVTDGDRHVFVVAVPRSANAPHMVDGSYWGRSDVGKRRLSDPEVRRLWEQRHAATANVQDSLRTLRKTFDRKPEHARHCHLIVLIEPVDLPRGTSIRELVGEKLPVELLIEGLGFVPQSAVNFREATFAVAHPRGIEAATLNPNTGVQHDAEEDQLQVMIRDGGTVAVAFGGATREVQVEGEHRRVVQVANILELTYSALRLAGRVATAYTFYNGQFRAGVYLDRVGRTFADFIASREFDERMPTPYREPDYIESTNFGLTRLIQEPETILSDLYRPLLQGLSVGGRYLPYDLSRARQGLGRRRV